MVEEKYFQKYSVIIKKYRKSQPPSELYTHRPTFVEFADFIANENSTL